ncbi:MAG: hypothetical protein WBA77_16915 [Microcoleaceae cyanobacterium]
MMHDGLECPKCGKHTIIQRSNDLFQCLNCDFVRDFSYIPEPVHLPPSSFEIENYTPVTSKPQSEDDAWDAVGAVMIFVIFALLLGL